MKRSKPAEQDGNDTTTHSHYPYILCHFANYVLCLLVVCIAGLWKVVGRVLLCVVHIDVHGVCCVVGGCNVVATKHGRYSLYAETVSSDGSYGMLGV